MNMKKVLSFILIAMMVLSLTACGNKTVEFGTFSVKLSSGWDFGNSATVDGEIECRDKTGQEFILIETENGYSEEAMNEMITDVQNVSDSVEPVEIGSLSGIKTAYVMDANNVQTEVTTYALFDSSTSIMYGIIFGCSDKVMEDFLAQLSK